MVERMQILLEQIRSAVQPGKASKAEAGRQAWAGMTPEERSQEMKRRMQRAVKKKAQKQVEKAVAKYEKEVKKVTVKKAVQAGPRHESRLIVMPTRNSLAPRICRPSLPMTAYFDSEVYQLRKKAA